MTSFANSPNAPTVKLSDQIYVDMFEAIVSGTYSLGAKLPTESELAEEFGVSRPTVRDALARLRDDGIISSRRGSGSYVTKVPDKAVLQFAPISSISDMQRCFEFRIGLEGEIAALAAQRSESADLTALRDALEALAQANRDGTVGTQADLTFHTTIADLAENRFYNHVMASLRDNIAAGMKVTRSLTRQRPEDRKNIVQAEHAAIVKAIENGDPEAARTAMRLHLTNARTRLFEGVMD